MRHRRMPLFSIIVIGLFSTVLLVSKQTALSQVRQQGQATRPAPPTSKTKIEVKEFSGEFEQWVKSLTINSAETITFRYSTDQPGATSAIWQVSDKPVASGPQTRVAQAPHVIASNILGAVPAPGHVRLFDINFALFAPKTPPASPQNYWVYIVTMDAQQQPVGLASAPVKITYRHSQQEPVNFGPSAVYPSVEMVSYMEKIGMVPLTQLHYAGADVTLRVKNNGGTEHDPMSVSVTDYSLLMRPKTPPADVPSLQPSASQLVSLHLDAILPPPTSQLPEDKQYSQWSQEYRDRCGVELRAVMNWRGSQAQAPMNNHLETALVQEGWADYAKVAPSTAICDSKQCVKPCQIARNIRKELDGHTVGYSFFVGLYPKFGAYGQARTSADGPARDFTSATKITVASVSKMVTAIAAVRILYKNGI